MVFDCRLHAFKSRIHSRHFYAHEVGALCFDFWNITSANSVGRIDVSDGDRVKLCMEHKGLVHGRGYGSKAQTTRALAPWRV